jgi:hypothetical protein
MLFRDILRVDGHGGYRAFAQRAAILRHAAEDMSASPRFPLPGRRNCAKPARGRNA